MDDLVKRLRKHGGNGFAIGTEAAAEIERLREEKTDYEAEILRIHNDKVDHFNARIEAERKCADLTAENAALRASRDDDQSHTPAYWQGYDDAVAGVAMRWTQALTAPIPAPGTMNEPLESLYRRTEALRADAERHRFMMADLRWQVFSHKRGAQPVRYAMRHDGEGWGGWHDTPDAAIDAAMTKEPTNG